MGEETTQLFVHCHGLDEEAEQRIADLMDEAGLPVTTTEGESGEMYIQMTNGFVADEKNKADVDALFGSIKEEFEDLDADRSIGEGAGYQHLPFDWIYEFQVQDEDWL